MTKGIEPKPLIVQDGWGSIEEKRSRGSGQCLIVGLALKYQCEELLVSTRRFRDLKLRKLPFGIHLIDIYYKNLEQLNKLVFFNAKTERISLFLVKIIVKKYY